MTTKQYEDAYAMLTDDLAEQEVLRLKGTVFDIVVSSLKQKGWTQARAAEELKVSQPRISDLMNGRISLFSLDMLINFHYRLGGSVDVSVQVM